jgi:glutathione S-transferase
MVAVAYRLTMEASHRDAVNAWLSATPTLPMGERPASSSYHIHTYAGLWRTFRGPEHYQLDDEAAVADARDWLAEHLDELHAFVGRVEAKMEEDQR